MFGLNRIQRRLFLLMAGIIVLLAGVLLLRESSGRVSEETVQLENIMVSTAPVQDEPDTIRIYLAGQVKQPGVISVLDNCRLVDALSLAGGALPDADLSLINLAQRVRDEEMYYIPAQGEDIPVSLQHGVNELDGKININTADQRLLETLDGIGPARALRIIEYREKNGGFSHLEEIMNISGIGDRIFEGIRDRIMIR